MSLDVYLFDEFCPHCYRENNVFSTNITHNLGQMADACGVYDACWRPDENNFDKAKDIIEILKSGISKLESNPNFYEKFNSPNGWGTYDHFLSWLKKYLDACIKYPNARIAVRR